MKFLSKSFCLIVLLSLNLFFCPVIRSEDETEDEVVNEEGSVNDEGAEGQTAAETEADELTGEAALSSPFVKTHVLFVQPESSDLPAGKLVKLLVGFHNNGSSGFVVEAIEGSFRYPQEFSYHIQNFSLFEYNKVVEGDREATFDYMFTPSEAFSSRQFGLTIEVKYRNLEGQQFFNTVFNETVNVVEPDEGLDGETFFLYIFLAAILVLCLFGAYHLLSVFKRKSRGKSSASYKVSNGSSTNSGDVDFEWIPKEHLQTNKSPRQSPRQRNVRKNGNAVSASGNSSNDEQ